MTFMNFEAHTTEPHSHTRVILSQLFLETLDPSSIGKLLAVPAGICRQVSTGIQKRESRCSIPYGPSEKKSEDVTIWLRFVPHSYSDLNCHLEHRSPTPPTHHIFFCRTEKLQAGGLVQFGEYLHKQCPGLHLKQPVSQIRCCTQQVRGGSRRM